MKGLILAAAALGLSATAASANCGAAHDDVAKVDRTTLASIAADQRPATSRAATTEQDKATVEEAD